MTPWNTEKISKTVFCKSTISLIYDLTNEYVALENSIYLHMAALLRFCNSPFSIMLIAVRKIWNDDHDKQARVTAHWCITKTKKELIE